MIPSSFAQPAKAVLLAGILATFAAAEPGKPYRLTGVDLKQQVIWGAELRVDEQTGLAFGGQDQLAEDGRPHTRILVDGKWRTIHEQLHAKNPCQRSYKATWELRNLVRNLLSKHRNIYFEGFEESQELTVLAASKDELTTIRSALEKLTIRLSISDTTDRYQQQQHSFARTKLPSLDLFQPNLTRITAAHLKALHRAQIQLEIAAAALDAEPPARALACGSRRGEADTPVNSMVYDARTKLFVLFGGDHLDYLTNDVWVFDTAQRRWTPRHPKLAPPPRANHNLTVKDGIVTVTGGYTYASNTDYVGGQYVDLNDGEWKYDIAKDEWTGSGLVPGDSRTYRTGPFHPEYYLQGERPSEEQFQKWIAEQPANQWIPTNPPQRPRLNRDWGCARLDPKLDILLRWSGGHSAHGGTDVPHFHFATNRWELPYPVEFPLGQLYSNTSYPNGYNFNLRPWITGHTYQNYAYDVTSGMLVKAGRPNHSYVYDPKIADWVGRHKKPKAMTYNSCFYTLTLTATNEGIACWDRYGKVHKYEGGTGKWTEVELSGVPLPGAYVDNSTITYDSQRNRLLIFAAPGYKKPYDGSVHSVDMTTWQVTRITPKASELGARFAFIDRCCYDPDNDLVLIPTHLKKSNGEEAEKKTPTPAFDCKRNVWITLDLDYEVGERYGRPRRDFPHGRSCGLVYDSKRKLYWGTDTNSQIYLLRLKR